MNSNLMTESIPEVDELREEVEEINLQIMKREPNDHESKMFDLKFEYGFREQVKKVTRLRGGKVIKKREKREILNIGGGGAADKLKDA